MSVATFRSVISHLHMQTIYEKYLILDIYCCICKWRRHKETATNLLKIYTVATKWCSSEDAWSYVTIIYLSTFHGDIMSMMVSTSYTMVLIKAEAIDKEVPGYIFSFSGQKQKYLCFHASIQVRFFFSMMQ